MVEVVKDENKGYRFVLKTREGNSLLNSIAFQNEESVKQVIAELPELVNIRAVFERKTDYSGKFLFNLKDRNGRVLGVSQLYDSEAGMENGIVNLRKSILSLPEDFRL